MLPSESASGGGAGVDNYPRLLRVRYSCYFSVESPPPLLPPKRAFNSFDCLPSTLAWPLAPVPVPFPTLHWGGEQRGKTHTHNSTGMCSAFFLSLSQSLLVCLTPVVGNAGLINSLGMLAASSAGQVYVASRRYACSQLDRQQVGIRGFDVNWRAT